ncbi:MAG: hypothetical protein ACM31C_08910 [Acidobacteriota bacterium]
MRSIVLALLAIAACQNASGGPPKPSDKPSDRFGHDMTVRLHMHENFGLLRTIELEIIHGRLAAAQALALAIGETPDEPGLEPFAKRAAAVRARAAELANARDIAEACRREAKLAAACADCHVDAGVLPEFSPPPREPPDHPTVRSRMVRHLWASERMWEGLVGDSDESWRAGLDILAATPLPFADKTDERAPLAAKLQQLARDATQTQATDQLRDRARWYGDMLATCAACHATR